MVTNVFGVFSSWRKMMPRKARLDVHNILHHVMARGIEQGSIFRNDGDREDFTDRLSDRAEETKTVIYAWALIPNHFHILLRSGHLGLPHFIHRLLTGCAVRFNRRHKRSGHLFQNRYISIVCEEDPYFMELSQYIHLNPIKVRIVNTMDELDSYPWCGHSVIMGKKKFPWQDVEYVLQYLGGGGLIRSSEGQISQRQRKNPVLVDQRILGTGDFVNNLLTRKLKQKSLSLAERQQKMDEIIRGRCEKAGITLKQLQGGSRTTPLPRIRSEIAHALVEDLGIPYAEIARQLGVSHVAILKMIKKENNYE